MPEGQKLECAAILPGFATGPYFIKQKFSTADRLKGFFDGEGGNIYGWGYNWPIALIDVRDVAEAHLQCILKPEANGQRFLLSSEHSYSCILNNWIYNRHHKTHPQMKYSNETLGLIKKLDNQNVKDILGINFRDMKSSLEEMSDQLVEKKYYG